MLFSGKKSSKRNKRTDLKSYDVSKLPLPVHPGDTVWFEADGKLEAAKVSSVGIDINGILIIVSEGSDYVVGTEDGVFLSEQDGRQYIKDPASIPADYGKVNYRKLELPFYPGMTFYYCDFDGFESRWDIYKEYFTVVMFDEDGTIRVGDGASECNVAGKEIDPCFETMQEAKEYCRSHKH